MLIPIRPASFDKYLLGQTLNGLGRSPNPVLAAVTTANRTWNDAKRDCVPQCDRTSLAANGECGALDNQLFGSVTPSATFDPESRRRLQPPSDQLGVPGERAGTS